MRQPEPRIIYGTVLMSDINFDIFCRHELVPILMALQHLYLNCPSEMSRILDLIKRDIVGDCDENLGCPGMTYWEILVLAAVRLGCNYTYDALHDLANNHMTLRDVMRVSRLEGKRKYSRTAVHDNVSGLSAKTVFLITDIILEIGHKIIPAAVEKVRGDSFVAQKNIHYPTDASLIFDGVRKIIELTARLANGSGIIGWRKHKDLVKKAKKILRRIQKVAAGKQKNREAEPETLYGELIGYAGQIITRSLDTIITTVRLRKESDPSFSMVADEDVSEIYHFLFATEYMCELAQRRVFEGEEIPNREKIFSLFEQATELINRGKKPCPYEFGHRILVIQDSAGFIIHARVMGIGMTDEKVLVGTMKKLQEKFNDKIRIASFDKGFWTPNNLRELSDIVETPCLPKKGRRSEADSKREGSEEFGKARKWHPGIESAIHALTAGNGLAVCRDKGEDGYERYLALAVLGRNLHTLGTHLLKKEIRRRKKHPKAA